MGPFSAKGSYLASIVLSLTTSAAALCFIAMVGMQREGSFDTSSAMFALYERIHSGPSGAVTVDVLVAANLAVALLVKLYRALVMEKITIAERSPARQAFAPGCRR